MKKVQLGETDLATIKGFTFVGQENANTDDRMAGLLSFEVDDGVSTPTTENVLIHILGTNDAPELNITSADINLGSVEKISVIRVMRKTSLSKALLLLA